MGQTLEQVRIAHPWSCSLRAELFVTRVFWDSFKSHCTRDSNDGYIPYVLLASYYNRIVGFCIYEISTLSSFVELTHIEVTEPFRRHGIGTKLVHALADMDNRNGISPRWLHAEVPETNQHAQGFFAACRFIQKCTSVDEGDIRTYLFTISLSRLAQQS